MKYIRNITTTLILLLTILLIGCARQQDDTSNEIMQDDKDMMEAKLQYKNEWKQFKDYYEAVIDSNEQRIIEFKEEMRETNTEAKNKYENKILTLERKNIELKKKLYGYEYESIENWQKFKQNLSDDMDNFKESFNEILDHRN